MSLSHEDMEFLEECSKISSGLKIAELWHKNDIKRLLRIVEGLMAQIHILETGGNSPNEMDQEIQRLRKERDGLREELASWHKHLDPCKDCGHRQFVPHTCNP